MDFNKLSIATFNMHGFRNGVSMLIDLCNNNSNIIAFQEHWLRSDECDRFSSIHDDYNFHAVSAMDDILAKGILSVVRSEVSVSFGIDASIEIYRC